MPAILTVVMRWTVAFVCAGLGVPALSCGGSSRSASPEPHSDAGNGGRAGEANASSAGSGPAGTNAGGAVGGAPTQGHSSARAGATVGDGSAAIGAAGEGAYCACDSNHPVCAERLACDGGPLWCPPTLDAWLTYDNYQPREPVARAQALYGVCADGKIQFVQTDALGEGGTLMVFDDAGRLLFDGNYSGWLCGEPPSADSDVPCRWCDILRAGGLSEVDEAGAGGAGGSAATPTNSFGVPYCLVDDQGRLVMPVY